MSLLLANRALISSVSEQPELHTFSNAAADPNGTEANATTGFLSTNLNVFQSQSSVVNVGTYAIEGNANGSPLAGARFFTQLNIAPFNVVAGNTYRFKFNIRHVGSGDRWRVYIGLGNNGTDNLLVEINNTDTVFQSIEYDWLAVSGNYYFNIQERSGTNDGGVYFDNFSVKQV
jgi:hypothetical protein